MRNPQLRVERRARVHAYLHAADEDTAEIFGTAGADAERARAVVGDLMKTHGVEPFKTCRNRPAFEPLPEALRTAYGAALAEDRAAPAEVEEAS